MPIEEVPVELSDHEIEFIESKSGDSEKLFSAYIRRLIVKEMLKEGERVKDLTSAITRVWGGPESLSLRKFEKIHITMGKTLKDQNPVSDENRTNGLTKLFMKKWKEAGYGSTPEVSKVNELTEMA